MINRKDAQEIITLFERRISERIPVEYISSKAFYLGREFYVNKNVLIPRSLMNTRFEYFIQNTVWNNNKVLDLCTGSGCIGITLALLNPNISVDLVDISPEALKVAQYNIEHYKIADRVKCIRSDLFDNLNNTYDLIVTNPPYVTSADYKRVPQEFRHEPKLALESGKDGLEIVKRIISTATEYLNPNGKIIAEVGYTAAKQIKKQFPDVPFKWMDYEKPKTDDSKFNIWFNKWVKPLVSMDCIFILEKNANSI